MVEVSIARAAAQDDHSSLVTQNFKYGICQGRASVFLLSKSLWHSTAYLRWGELLRGG